MLACLRTQWVYCLENTQNTQPDESLFFSRIYFCFACLCITSTTTAAILWTCPNAYGIVSINREESSSFSCMPNSSEVFLGRLTQTVSCVLHARKHLIVASCSSVVYMGSCCPSLRCQPLFSSCDVGPGYVSTFVLYIRKTGVNKIISGLLFNVSPLLSFSAEVSFCMEWLPRKRKRGRTNLQHDWLLSPPSPLFISTTISGIFINPHGSMCLGVVKIDKWLIRIPPFYFPTD